MRRQLLQDILKSQRSISGLFVICRVLLVVCLCAKELRGAKTVMYSDGLKEKDSSLQVLHHVFKRQEDSSSREGTTSIPASSPNTGEDVGQFFTNYWYIFIVLVIFVVIVSVFVCACVMKVKKRNHQSQIFRLNSSSKSPESSRSLQQQSSIDNHSLPQHTGSSVADLASGSPISLSVGPTPIPSPQPSHTSSQKSYRSNSPSKRRRNHSSGHVSSSSEETIRAHDFHSTTSLVSHLSSLGHGGGAIHPKVSRTESVNSAGGERMPPYSHSHRHSGRHRHRRTTSNPHIKLYPSSVPDSHSLCSIPSTSSMHSMGSSHSVRSGMSHRSHSDSQKTLVDVDVRVHIGSEQEHEARKEIAAALAESARKLAQSAANFGQDEEDSLQNHQHRSNSQLTSRGYAQPSSLQSRRQLFPSYSSSVLLGHEEGTFSPGGLPSVSLDRPRNVATLDRPHHTFPIRSELSRRNSLTRAPPPESPLRISHSRYSSQRSLSHEGHPINYQKLPAHIQAHLVHSADSHTSDRGISLSRREVSLDNLHNSPSPPFSHPYNAFPRPDLEDSPPPSILTLPPNLTASLDFSRQEHTSPQATSPDGGTHIVRGIHSPRSYSHLRMDGLHSVLESDHGISPDSGMGNGDYGTGTESSSSTLKSSSHVEKKDRLSRLSEKSEYLDGEEHSTDHTVVNGEDQSDSRRTSSHSDQTNPTRKNSSNSNKPSISTTPNGHYVSNSSAANMITVAPSSCPSNQSGNVTSNTNHQQSTVKSERSSHEPNSCPHHPTIVQSNNSQSSGSAVSLDENSMASGYAATGSGGSSAENLSKVHPTSSVSSDTHMIHQDVESQFSYPLERLLSQPLSYDIESDDIDIPAPLNLSTRVANHKHSHHGDTMSVFNNSQGHCQTQRSRLKNGQAEYNSPHHRLVNGLPQYHAQNNGSFPHSHTKSGSMVVPDSFVNRGPGQVHVPYHSVPHHIQANGYQSGSITVDV